QNVGEVPLRQVCLPEVVGLQPVGVRRVARAIVPALVERQEPGRLALQVRAHPHLVVVHGEMDDAAAELEQQLLRIAVALVLLDRVLDRLLGQLMRRLARISAMSVMPPYFFAPPLHWSASSAK